MGNQQRALVAALSEHNPDSTSENGDASSYGADGLMATLARHIILKQQVLRKLLGSVEKLKEKSLEEAEAAAPKQCVDSQSAERVVIMQNDTRHKTIPNTVSLRRMASLDSVISALSATESLDSLNSEIPLLTPTESMDSLDSGRYRTHCGSSVEKWDRFESSPNKGVDLFEGGAVAVYRASEASEGWAWRKVQASRCVPQCGRASGTIKVEEMHPLHIAVTARDQLGNWNRLFAYYHGGQIWDGTTLCADRLPELRTGSVVTVSLDRGAVTFENGDTSAAFNLRPDVGDIALSVTLWQNASVRLL